MRIWLAWAALAAGIAAPALAHNDERAPEIDGALSWTVLEQTEALEWADADGITHLRPAFTPDVTKVDGQAVRIVGFPLAIGGGAGGGRPRLLLFAAKPDCFFHMAVGPARFIETDYVAPPSLGDGPLYLAGTLELVKADRGGVFYRLRGAQPVTLPAR